MYKNICGRTGHDHQIENKLNIHQLQNRKTNYALRIQWSIK
jgi:hypothetical protein